jgi:hypothetical protein
MSSLIRLLKRGRISQYYHLCSALRFLMSCVTSLLHNRKPALYSLPFFFISSQLVFRRRCMDLFVYSPICCCFCDVTTLTNKVHANIYKCAHTHIQSHSVGMRSSKVTFLVCIVLRPNSWTKSRQKS